MPISVNRTQIKVRPTYTLDPRELCFRSIGKTTHLPAKEQIELVKKAQRGDEKSKNILIESNLRWVSKIAFQMAFKYKLDVLDLIQEGTFAIERSIHNFKPAYSSFIVYASSGIINDMKKFALMNRNDPYINTKGRIRPSVNSTNINNSKKIFLQSLDARETEIDDQIDCIKYNETPDKNVARNDYLRDIRSILKHNLNNTEFGVIVNYFGLFNTNKLTLAELGNMFDLSKERIRQIREKAESKLKSISQLESFFRTIFTEN